VNLGLIPVNQVPVAPDLLSRLYWHGDLGAPPFQELAHFLQGCHDLPFESKHPPDNF
jgi:hypothetical protein